MLKTIMQFNFPSFFGPTLFYWNNSGKIRWIYNSFFSVCIFQTIAVTQNFVSCRLDKHFASPEKFIPDRWLKSSDAKLSTSINPYLVLPFSHGMRSCIARRFAEQNMLVLLLRVWPFSHSTFSMVFCINFFYKLSINITNIFQLIRKYEIGWEGVDRLDIKTTTTINKPEHPVLLTFKPRSL